MRHKSTRTRSISPIDLEDLIPAVLYLRMSSDQQAGSIEQQRDELVTWAESAGYRIVGEYVEPGKSGSLEQEKRTEFNRMLLDSASSRFQAVLCWASSRFGRLDTLKGAFGKDVLRTNGVHLATKTEGRIDWDTFAGRVQDFMYSEANHKFSLDWSENTIRGRKKALELGFWPNGKVPYGFDKLFVGNGTEQLVKRNDLFSKPRNWVRHLVLNDAEAEVVRWVFDQYVTHDQSLRAIASGITSRGVARPDGSQLPWTKDGVRDILANKAYCGFAHIGGVCKTLRKKDSEVHNRIGKHEKAGVLPEIVSLDMWSVAVAKVGKNKSEGIRVHSAKASALSGVLVCGHCGYRMAKHERTDRKGVTYTYFNCDSPVRRPGGGCAQWRVREEDILPIVLTKLCEEVDRQVLETLDCLNREDQGEEAPGGLASLQAKLTDLQARLKKGQVNFLTAPDELRSDLEKVLLEWKGELDSVEKQIQTLSVGEGVVTKFASWWDRMRGRLVTVKKPDWGNPRLVRSPLALGETDKAKLLEAMGRVAGKVRAEWTEEGLTIGQGSEVEIDEEGQGWRLEEVEEITSQAILTTDSELRGFLKRIGFKVILYWKPKGTRYHELDKGRIEASFDSTLLGPVYFCPDNSENSLGAFSNKCNHARIRDRG